MAATTMVNARVKTADKAVVDQVLRAQQWTWSQLIQGLVASIARTRAIPEAVTAPAADDDAEWQRKLDILMSVAGMVTSPELITDEDDDRLLYDEMMRRHG